MNHFKPTLNPTSLPRESDLFRGSRRRLKPALGCRITLISSALTEGKFPHTWNLFSEVFQVSFLQAKLIIFLSGVFPMLCIGWLERFQPPARSRHAGRARSQPVFPPASTLLLSETPCFLRV